MSFPAALSNAVDGVTEIVAAHLNNLEAKVGIDNSSVPASLDYLLKNAASIDPGHKHSKLWASDGSPEAVTVDAAGNVGIGTTGPVDKLKVVGGISVTQFASSRDSNSTFHEFKLDATGSGSKTWISSNRLRYYPAADQFARTSVTEKGSLILLDEEANIKFYTQPSTSQAGNYSLDPKMVIQGNGNVGINLTSPGKKLDVNGYLRGAGVFNTLNSAPADEDLAPGECALWFDKTNGAAKLMIKAKQNDGTVKTGSVSLS